MNTPTPAYWHGQVKDWPAAFIKLEGSDMKWIDIQERLPGEYISVLLYDKNKEMAYVGYRLNNRWWYGNHYGRWDAPVVVTGDITHWMPLPDPPQIVDNLYIKGTFTDRANMGQ